MAPSKKQLVPLTQPVLWLLAEGIDPRKFCKQVVVEVDSVDPKDFILATPERYDAFTSFERKLDAHGLRKIGGGQWLLQRGPFNIYIGGTAFPGEVWWLQVSDTRSQDLLHNKTYSSFDTGWQERLLSDMDWWLNNLHEAIDPKQFIISQETLIGYKIKSKTDSSWICGHDQWEYNEHGTEWGWYSLPPEKAMVFSPEEAIKLRDGYGADRVELVPVYGKKGKRGLKESNTMNVRGRPFEVTVFPQQDGFVAIAYVEGKQVASAPSADRMTAERDLHDKLVERFFPPVQYDPNRTYESLEADLIKVSRGIKHCGDYGTLWFNPATKAVHWTAADSDSPDNGYTDTRDIAKMLKLPGVTHVEVGDEWSPDEDEGWVRLDDSLTPAEDLATSVLLESPQFKTLKANKARLDDGERAKAGSAPIWKAQVNGTTWYCSNTHRCYQAHKSISDAVRAYRDVVEPSG